MFKVGDRVKTKDFPSDGRRVGLVGVVSEQGIIAPDAKAIFVNIDGENGSSAFYTRNLELEETPQELADKLRAARVQTYELAKQLRDLGFWLTFRGVTAYTPELGDIPLVIEKTTTVTTKESL